MKRKRYCNLDGVLTDKSYKDIRKWQRERRAQIPDESYVVPQSDVKEISFLQSNRTKNTITWIGHSTFLIQYGGLNIVTDPVWAMRMGFAKRQSDPGLNIRELPLIDVVLISHAHYDHLHIRSLKALPGKPKLLVPEGLSRMLQRKGFSSVEEIPWWQSTTVQEVTFTMMPAQHWTRRTLRDMNTSHWGGWLIHQSGKRSRSILFAGDSGYFRGFKNISETYEVDTAILPIGAYAPEWFMQASHMTPEEAILAFLDLNARQFIPMHYGAFRLADDTAEQALSRLHQEWDCLQLDKEQLNILSLGETLHV